MRRNFKIVLTLLLTLAMLACLAGCGAVFTSASANNSGGSGAGGNSAPDTYTPPALDESLTYFADIDIEGFGVITVPLHQTVPAPSSSSATRTALTWTVTTLCSATLLKGLKWWTQTAKPHSQRTATAPSRRKHSR